MPSTRPMKILRCCFSGGEPRKLADCPLVTSANKPNANQAVDCWGDASLPCTAAASELESQAAARAALDENTIAVDTTSPIDASVFPPAHRWSDYGSRPELEAFLPPSLFNTALLGSFSHQPPTRESPNVKSSRCSVSSVAVAPASRSHPDWPAPRNATLDQLLGAVSSACWVGQGGQGAVVKAQWRSGAPVAVKWIVTDGVSVPAALMEALLAKMLAHPFLVQTFDCAVCHLDRDLSLLTRQTPKTAQPLHVGATGASAPSAPGTALKADASDDQLALAFAVDSFEGGQQIPGVQPVDCVDVLKQLGAAPGKYVVQIVSEWCDEGTLHAAIRKGVFRAHGRRSRTWALRALLRTAREVALGMCHLHSLNIIHGDLKPGNVLLKSSRVDSRGFVAKVADFGLSRLCGKHVEFVATEEWGTVPYMAGEYLDNKLCKSSDVYSFGVLLWQMYTGKAPFAGHLEAQVAVGVMLGNLQLEWPASMPPPLLRLGQSCCRHEPDQRPSFKECVVALAGLEAQLRDLAARAKAYNALSSALPPRALFPSRSTMLPLGAFGAAHGATFGGGIAALGVSSPRADASPATAELAYGKSHSEMLESYSRPQRADPRREPAGGFYGKAHSTNLNPGALHGGRNPGPVTGMEQVADVGRTAASSACPIGFRSDDFVHGGHALQSFPQSDCILVGGGEGCEGSPGLLPIEVDCTPGSSWRYVPAGMPRVVSAPAMGAGAVAGAAEGPVNGVAADLFTTTAALAAMLPDAWPSLGPSLVPAICATGHRDKDVPATVQAQAPAGPCARPASPSAARVAGIAGDPAARRLGGHMSMAAPGHLPCVVPTSVVAGSSQAVPGFTDSAFLPAPACSGPTAGEMPTGTCPPTWLPYPESLLQRPGAVTEAGGTGSGGGHGDRGENSAAASVAVGVLSGCRLTVLGSPAQAPGSVEVSSSVAAGQVTATNSTDSCSGLRTGGGLGCTGSIGGSPAAALLVAQGPGLYFVGCQGAFSSQCTAPSTDPPASGLQRTPQHKHSQQQSRPNIVTAPVNRGCGASGYAPSMPYGVHGTPMSRRTASCVLLSDAASGPSGPAMAWPSVVASGEISTTYGAADTGPQSMQGHSAALLTRQLQSQQHPTLVQLSVNASKAAAPATATPPPATPFGPSTPSHDEGHVAQSPAASLEWGQSGLGALCLYPVTPTVRDGTDPRTGSGSWTAIAEAALAGAGLAYRVSSGIEAAVATAPAASLGRSCGSGIEASRPAASATIAAAVSLGHRFSYGAATAARAYHVNHQARPGLAQGPQLGVLLGGSPNTLMRGASSRRGSTGPVLQHVPEDDGDSGTGSGGEIAGRSAHASDRRGLAQE